jgi:succinyldiaminopimelate transaminase
VAFVVPPYPYDKLEPAKLAAAAVPGGLVDLSVGTPCDPPPTSVLAMLSASDSERGYPTSLGSAAFRDAAAGWMQRRLGATVEPGSQVAACIGTKEFVATTPGYLRLLRDDRDTVLYPAVSYPTYEMGALLAGLRAVAVPLDADGRLMLDTIDPGDTKRALCLWVNTPGNPAGNLDDLQAVAAWGRSHDVWVISDECYSEFTWSEKPQTMLTHGTEGVLAVHSLSKRSNLAGLRVGFYAGDKQLVRHLSEVRKHAGFMVPGPAQAAAAVAYSDDDHVDLQRSIYYARLEQFLPALRGAGFDVAMPGGAFYLWARVPGVGENDQDGQHDGQHDGDGWAAANWLATQAGVLVSPGDFYGSVSGNYIRVAMVQPDDRISLAAQRLAAAGSYIHTNH